MVVYSFLEMYPHWVPLAMSIGAWTIGQFSIWYGKNLPEELDTYDQIWDVSKSQKTIRGGYVALGFSAIFLLVEIGVIYRYFQLRSRYQRGQYLTVQGRLQNFRSDWVANTGIRFTESFSVDSVMFSYNHASDSDYGYSEPLKMRNLVRENDSVRINYIPYLDPSRPGYPEHQILRFEVLPDSLQPLTRNP